MDKVGSMAGNLICSVVAALNALLLMVGGGNSTVLLYVGVAMFSFIFSPLTQGAALLVRDVFGDKEYSAIYSFMTTSLLVSGGLSPLIYAQLYDRTQSYATYPVFVFIVAIIVTIITPVIYLIGKKSSKDMKINM